VVLVLLPLSLLLAPVRPHGGLVYPPPWQDGDHRGVEEVYSGHLHHNPVQVEPITGNKIDKVTQFLTDQAFIGGHGTAEFRYGPGEVTNFKEGGCGKRCQRTKVPWAAPGVAPAFGGGCGVFGGNPVGCDQKRKCGAKDNAEYCKGKKKGETVVISRTHADPRAPGSRCLTGGTFMGGPDAREMVFPQAANTEWPLGSVQEVAFITTGWHEGGYTYRLCPLGANGTLGLTEECFQKNILAFATDSTLLRKPGQENIGQWKEYKKVDISVGTHPAGSVWRPLIPYKSAPKAAYIRKDQVAVPAGLAPGNYVLSWRWDIATADGQVWLSCSNVKLV